MNCCKQRKDLTTASFYHFEKPTTSNFTKAEILKVFLHSGNLILWYWFCPLLIRLWIEFSALKAVVILNLVLLQGSRQKDVIRMICLLIPSSEHFGHFQGGGGSFGKVNVSKLYRISINTIYSQQFLSITFSIHKHSRDFWNLGWKIWK